MPCVHILQSSHAPDPSAESSATAGLTSCPVLRRHAGRPDHPDADPLLDELPVAMVYNGVSHAVLMSTPLDLEDLARGFSLTEGVVDNPTEVLDVEVHIETAHGLIDIRIPQRRFSALKERRRQMAGRTGCGLCGLESIEALPTLPQAPIPRRAVRVPDTESIDRALGALEAHPGLRQDTGCAHIAAWCAPDGTLRLLREDVGRHNALDKLIGALRNTATDSGFALVSSRASYEMVLKAARGDLPALVAMAAPTARAVALAREAAIGLVARARPGRSVVYHDPGLS